MGASVNEQIFGIGSAPGGWALKIERSDSQEWSPARGPDHAVHNAEDRREGG